MYILVHSGYLLSAYIFVCISRTCSLKIVSSQYQKFGTREYPQPMLGSLEAQHIIYDRGQCRKYSIEGSNSYVVFNCILLGYYSKTCLKRSLKNRQNKGIKDKW